MSAAAVLDRGLELALYVGIPTLLVAGRRWPIVRTVGPVIIAYAAGMLLGNLPGAPLDGGFALSVSSVAVALAIPLLLFSVDVPAWVRLARPTVISFGLAVSGVLVAGLAVPPLFKAMVPDAARIAGMLTGVYIGGTVNMVSIGAALGVPSKTFVLLNAADMVASTTYLLFMVTIAQRVLGRFLPAFPFSGGTDMADAPSARPASPVRAVLGGALLSALVVGAAALAGVAFSGAARDIATIVAISTFALGLSFVPRVRSMPLTYETGLFFILVFCVSVGVTARFSEIWKSSGAVMGYTAAFMTTGVAVHYILAAIFRIDRDTVIVTSAAAVWAPPIIPPVTAALRNRALLGPGIACGLVGYAIGNYLGLAIAWIQSR